MSTWVYFKEVLEKSVEKNGDKPLTTGWLLNIIKMSEKMEYTESYDGYDYGFDYWKE